MNRTKPNNIVLAIAPSTRGFGFALFEGDKLLDWGVKVVAGEKNKESLRKLRALVLHYHPGVLVHEDFSAKESRRSIRIRQLEPRIKTLANTQKVKVQRIPRATIKKAFLPGGKGNKDNIAARIADYFPEELGPRLPRKRRIWMSENYRMGIFEAAALGLVRHFMVSS